MKQPVSLYIYQFNPERVLIDKVEADDFGDFVVVSVDADGITDPTEIDDLHNELKEILPDKKLLLIDKELNIGFYGFREEDSKELPDGS